VKPNSVSRWSRALASSLRTLPSPHRASAHIRALRDVCHRCGRLPTSTERMCGAIGTSKMRPTIVVALD
jgi:hypothetical protein